MKKINKHQVNIQKTRHNTGMYFCKKYRRIAAERNRQRDIALMRLRVAAMVLPLETQNILEN